MRTIAYANGKSYGTVRGGIPVLIEKPNRKLRRLAARQAAQTNEGHRPCPSPTGCISSTTKEKEV